MFASNRDGTMDLYEKAVNGSEPERQLLKSDRRKTPTDWSRDGQFLLFDQEDPATGWDLAALPMKGDRNPFPLLQSEFNETQGAFSPDGKWLAYTSDETGGNQVYVQRFQWPAHQRKATTLQPKVAHLGRRRGPATLAI